MSKKKFPAGWDESRVQQVLDHYETQSDEEAVAEDEAAFESTTHTAIEVPVDLVPEVRELIANTRSADPRAVDGIDLQTHRPSGKAHDCTMIYVYHALLPRRSSWSC